MSLHLLEAVKEYFTPELVGKAAAYLGESDGKVTDGLNAVIPAALAGLVKKSEGGDLSTLLNLSKTAYETGLLNHVGSTFSAAGGGVPSIGPSLITGLFGDKFGSIANAVSSFTGLKGSSTSALFGTVVPLAFSLLGKFSKDSNAAPGAIASLLASQKNGILAAIPSGLNLAGLSIEPRKPAFVVAPEEKKKMNWLVPLLGLFGLAALIWFFNRDKTPASSEPVAIHDTVIKTTMAVMIKEPLKISLPNGVELNAYKGSIEDLLVAFVLDSAAQAGNDNWFDFNDLNFTFGTAEIIPESRKEVENIVEILKAFPNVKVKLGGYTDKVGDETANKKLSGERALAVANDLKNAGVGAQVEGAEGYGSEFAKYPASAPEEDRIKDRRVSLSVRAK